MQPSPAEYFSNARRALDFEDYVDILRRRWAWIATPTFAGLVLSVVVAFFWPDTYVSYATMRIVPSQVSQTLVPGAYSLQVADRINTLLQEVETSDNLIGLIKRYNLYPSEVKHRPYEDVVEDMKKDVKVKALDETPGQRGTMFKISFAYRNRDLARRVVDELASQLITNNVAKGRNQTLIATNFLKDEVAAAKAELDALDKKITDFRLANAGRLPEQASANQQVLSSLQGQLSATTEALNRISQEKTMLETQLDNAKSRLKSIVTTQQEAGIAVTNERLAQLNRAILEQETNLAGLRERYREDHPDIRSLKASIDMLKRERDKVAAQEEEAQASAKPRTVVNASAVQQQEEIKAWIKQLETQIQLKNEDAARLVRQQPALNEQIRLYQTRIQAGPVGESEYAKLTRDYNLAKTRYDDLKLRQSQNDMSRALIERGGSEELEKLEAASMPGKPTEPKRDLIIGVGVGLGSILGLFLAGAKEIKDASLKNVKDVRAYTRMSVLSSIPLLENALVLRRKRRLAFLAWSSALIVGVMMMSGSMYYYYYVVGH